MESPDPLNTGKTMGNVMLAIAFVIGIGLLTLFFDGYLARQSNPNRDPESRLDAAGNMEVMLEANRQGQYVLTGAVNGIAADFILDTGATEVVIPPGLAEASRLEYGYQTQAMTANGLVNIYSTIIEELQLGGITLRNVRASINPAMHESMVLLGMSALRQIEFTQQGSRLTLRQAN